jgi:hypothetical protein
VGLCGVHAIRYLEEQVNTCGLERLQRLRLGPVDCPLKRNAQATGGIFDRESTRWRPVVRFAVVTVMIQSPLGSGFLHFPRIGPAVLASCLSPFDILIPLSFPSVKVSLLLATDSHL